MKKLLILVCVLAFLSSCFKEDELLPGVIIYDQIAEANMVSEPGKDYQYQVYFDLSSGEAKAENSREAWDFGFTCDPSKPNIFTNTSLLMAVAATGGSDFNASYDPSDYNFNYERVNEYYTNAWISSDFNSNGTPKNQVFIIDMGRNISNQTRGYKLLQVESFNQNEYRLNISDLDHENLLQITIPINSTYNNLYVSLNNPESVLELEPPADEWDILFTKYMERLADGTDTVDYSVTGCLLNPKLTEAYFHEASFEDDLINYDQLDLSFIEEDHYSNQISSIGHNWKWYDLDQAAFLVLDKKSYFIKDSQGVNYKLHFTAFYDSNGSKGVVTFVYLPL